MTISVFDLFSVGIGPSSSHTVGPMKAAKLFADQLTATARIGSTSRVSAELFGSLGATGRGHGSITAVVLGLEGQEPATVDIETYEQHVLDVQEERKVIVAGQRAVHFDVEEDVVLRRRSLPDHPNGMVFRAWDGESQILLEKTYFSVGGGFVVEDLNPGDGQGTAAVPVPYPFVSSADLMEHCARQTMSISDIVLANECATRSESEVRSGLLTLWDVMKACVDRGCRRDGILPGGLGVIRRAPALFAALAERVETDDQLRAMEWVNLFALAVNEENAAGGRVVTAPTNGAAGIIPAVLHFFERFENGSNDDIIRFLLTAAAIGQLFKENASISGAAVGCQGEIGSACSMAAAALCERLGGTPTQVANAAEIGLEHNLGLTCDPVGGLVQIPCIERNAIASVKAINAARLAMHGDGTHVVSLDAAIRTMRDTGRDMSTKYKETSRGGLAVNVPEC